LWRGSRLEPLEALHAPLSQELGPLAPDTSVHCVPRAREASCRRWNGCFAWGLVAL